MQDKISADALPITLRLKKSFLRKKDKSKLQNKKKLRRSKRLIR
jgi:hypothetical protein